MNPLPIAFEVPRVKVAGYLLNVLHARGGAKARFFLAFGFRAEAPDAMAEALIRHACDPATARHERVRRRGGVEEIRLICEGPLRAPDGRSPRVRTVWMREEAGRVRFITAVPLT